jgi:cytochrome c oxidase subunit IV
LSPNFLTPKGILEASIKSKRIRDHRMQAEHKKALILIFAVLFACLFVSTVFITLYTENIAIAGVLIAVSAVLIVDILWVIKDKNGSAHMS